MNAQPIELNPQQPDIGITMSAPAGTALDYERVKDFFYAKLESDRHGHGRMESAFFHTAQWIYQQAASNQGELLERIAEQENELATLRSALQVHASESAALLNRHQLLLAAARNLRDVKGRHHSEQAFQRLIAVIDMELTHA